MAWMSSTNGPATPLQVGVAPLLPRFPSSRENDTFRIKFRNIVGWYRRYINQNGGSLRKIHPRCGICEYFLNYCGRFIKSCLELYIWREA